MISQPVSIGHYLFHYGNEGLLNTAGQLLLGVPKMEGNQVGSPGAMAGAMASQEDSLSKHGGFAPIMAIRMGKVMKNVMILH